MKFWIKTDRALEAVSKHLQEHITELNHATTEWVRQVTVALGLYTDAVNRKGLEASWDELHRLQYSRPKDNRPEYSKFMSALTHAKEAGQENIEVDEEDVDRIFNDNWDWRVVSKTANASYYQQLRR